MKITGKQIQAVSVEVDTLDFLRQLHGEWMRSVVKDEDAIIQNGQWEVYFRGSLEVEREATKEEIEVNAAFLKLQDVIGKMKK